VPPLRELQLRFAGALFDGRIDAAAGLVHGGALDPAARLRIYANNLREGFAKTLALEFPVIERLVGADYFAQLAREFLAEHPSRSGNLHHIGAPFADFLRARFADTEYACFADVAELEWAYQEVLVAADATPLDPGRLHSVDPSRYAQLRFSVAPACRFVRSRFPIVRIWSSNQPGAPEETIDLASGGDHVLVLRTSEAVELRRLPPAQFTLLEALAQGFPLGAALEAVQAEDFDLAGALRLFVALGVLADAVLPS
jgi:hypothetical protein